MTPPLDTHPIETALRTALSSLLHEQADPECTGEPSYSVTQAQAESLVEQLMRTPVVQNALEKPHIQAFVNGDVFEAGPDEYRAVYYEPCPTPSERCNDEYHHHGRGDHMIPPRMNPADRPATEPRPHRTQWIDAGRDEPPENGYWRCQCGVTFAPDGVESGIAHGWAEAAQGAAPRAERLDVDVERLVKMCLMLPEKSPVQQQARKIAARLSRPSDEREGDPR